MLRMFITGFRVRECQKHLQNQNTLGCSSQTPHDKVLSAHIVPKYGTHSRSVITRRYSQISVVGSVTHKTLAAILDPFCKKSPNFTRINPLSMPLSTLDIFFKRLNQPTVHAPLS